MKVLKICCNEWNNESRDERELGVCKELGFEIVVMTKGSSKKMGCHKIISGFDVYQYSTRPLGQSFPTSINRFISLLIWAYYARQFHPDVITGHDLLGLLVGWISTAFCINNKPKLVYDSHEFELGRNTSRGLIQTKMVGFLEGFLIGKCEFAIVVNDCIADEIQKIHHLKKRPLVVRNIPEYCPIDHQISNSVRKSLINEFNSTITPFIIMYHGVVVPGRGIETLLKLLGNNTNIQLLIMGNSQDDYLSELKNLSLRLNVSNRVIFKPAVPHEELWKFVSAVDVGMVTIPAVAKSYYYMLPNKFFEYIQGETPVICSNFPAIENIVDNYKIGLLSDPLDLTEINRKIEMLRLDKPLYADIEKNLKNAKKSLCWENEKKGLQEKYASLIGEV